MTRRPSERFALHASARHNRKTWPQDMVYLLHSTLNCSLPPWGHARLSKRLHVMGQCAANAEVLQRCEGLPPPAHRWTKLQWNVRWCAVLYCKRKNGWRTVKPVLGWWLIIEGWMPQKALVSTAFLYQGRDDIGSEIENSGAMPPNLWCPCRSMAAVPPCLHVHRQRFIPPVGSWEV